MRCRLYLTVNKIERLRTKFKSQDREWDQSFISSLESLSLEDECHAEVCWLLHASVHWFITYLPWDWAAAGGVAFCVGWLVAPHDPLVPVGFVWACDLQVALSQTLVIFGAVWLMEGERLALGPVISQQACLKKYIRGSVLVPRKIRWENFYRIWAQPWERIQSTTKFSYYAVQRTILKRFDKSEFLILLV